ncbi:hypothetical protein D3C78_1414880 [compost metagenome]
MPKLMVRHSPGASTAPSSRNWFLTRWATRTALAVSVCSSSTNSSPPKRATSSSARTCWTMARATVCRTRSPWVWPQVSLMRLKWSISPMSKVQGPCRGLRRLRSAASWKARRLSKLVSGSRLRSARKAVMTSRTMMASISKANNREKSSVMASVSCQ